MGGPNISVVLDIVKNKEALLEPEEQMCIRDSPSGMEKQPFIAFDVKKKTLHGNAGCNLINGGFETSTTNAKSISFPGVASTMMACPDMEVEGKILKAMNEVKSFDKLSGGGIGLYDANNALVIVLEK